MKSIALLGMVFLPPTFISVCLGVSAHIALLIEKQALFSTTFFNFGDDGSWQVSDKLWIYWATTIPATVVSVILWRMWLAHNDFIVKFVRQWLGRDGRLWGSMKVSRQIPQGSEKVDA
jgi:hypothetical protein